MSNKYVINPDSGRKVAIGGKAYRELIMTGKIKNTPFDYDKKPKKAKNMKKPKIRQEEDMYAKKRKMIDDDDYDSDDMRASETPLRKKRFGR